MSFSEKSIFETLSNLLGKAKWRDLDDVQNIVSLYTRVEGVEKNEAKENE